MAVVPCEVDSPCSVKLGIIDPQRCRAAWTGPYRFALVPKRPTGGARAAKADLHEIELGNEVVGERDRQATVTFDDDIKRFIALVHAPIVADSGTDHTPE